MKLVSVINEIIGKEKEMVGRGAYHRIYPSKKNPNIVYKLGDERIVKRWYDIFVSHPDFFPKVYGEIKKTKFPIKNNWNQVVDVKDVAYVTLEKVNTNDFIKFYNEIDTFFVEISLRKVLQTFTNDETIMDYIISVGKEIKKLKPELMDRYYEFINLVHSVYEILPSADLHENQFGYDNDGKLKCIDI
jgi:NurA-like 5'-3' nuclease